MGCNNSSCVLSTSTPTSSQTPSQSFHSQYMVCQRLASGSFASVYSVAAARAQQPQRPGVLDVVSASWSDDTRLVVKVMDLRMPGSRDLDQRQARMWERETTFLRHLSRGGSPSIVRLAEAFREDDIAYIVMERCAYSFLEGLERMPRFTEGTLRGIVQQMLCGLQAIHEAGVVHRDVKPSNFLFTKAGDVKLCDFGLSDMLSLSPRGAVGTTPFMAPEMFDSTAYGPKVDVWALGVIVYALLFGKCPYLGRTCKDVKAAIQNCLPAPDFLPVHQGIARGSGVSMKITAFAKRLLRRSAAERPTAAEALADHFMTSSAEGCSLLPALEAAKRAGILAHQRGEDGGLLLDFRLASLQSKHQGGDTPWSRRVSEEAARVASLASKTSAGGRYQQNRKPDETSTEPGSSSEQQASRWSSMSTQSDGRAKARVPQE